MNEEKLIKGNYLTFDEHSDNKIVYFSPKQKENISEDNNENLTDEVENEVIAIASYDKKEFEGEIVKIYKNNLVVNIDSNYRTYIKENESINIRIVKDENAYECSLKILGIKEEGENLIIVLSIPVIEKKVDRRRFFRLSVKFGIRYYILPKGEYHTITDVPPGCFLKIKKTVSHDISAGGIAIVSDEYCEVGTYVLVCVYLPNKIDILCKVVRTAPYEAANKILLSMKYIYIHELDRDKIAAFIIKNEIYRRNNAKKNKTV